MAERSIWGKPVQICRGCGIQHTNDLRFLIPDLKSSSDSLFVDHETS